MIRTEKDRLGNSLFYSFVRERGGQVMGMVHLKQRRQHSEKLLEPAGQL